MRLHFLYLISKDLKHGLVCLFLAEEFGRVVTVLVLVDDDVLLSRLQTVLDSAVTGD